MYDTIPIMKIQNKADAMHFAINTTLHYICGEGNKVDYEEAKKLFDFICENVEFPEESTKQMLGGFMPILEAMLGGNSTSCTAGLKE
jgi:hypothetical protein